jgi:hypothetical protein
MHGRNDEMFDGDRENKSRIETENLIVEHDVCPRYPIWALIACYESNLSTNKPRGIYITHNEDFWEIVSGWADPLDLRTLLYS